MEISCLPFHQLSLDQLYAIMVVRQEVFVVEQDCPYLDADGKDQHCWHVMGHDTAGNLVAYTRLVPKGISYTDYASIGRVVTATSARGKGFGKHIMEASIQACKKLFEEDPIKISAQCYILEFYESLGFEAIGDTYLEDNIPHKSMILHQ